MAEGYVRVWCEISPTDTPRGTAPYRAALTFLLNVGQGPVLSAAINSLWEDYGWRGIADVHELVLDDLHRHLDPDFRTPTGAIRLPALLHADLSEEQLLEQTVRTLQTRARRGRQDDFSVVHQDILRYNETTKVYARSWQQALDAYARNAGHEVWPILARTPGLRDAGKESEQPRYATYLLVGLRSSVTSFLTEGPPDRFPSHS
ncbi:MAG TPA: hypothetical protein VIM84_11300 [Gemmatimonadales bacterium]